MCEVTSCDELQNEPMNGTRAVARALRPQGNYEADQAIVTITGA